MMGKQQQLFFGGNFLYDRHALPQARWVLVSYDHPLLKEFVFLSYGWTRRSSRVKSNGFSFSIYPNEVKVA